MSPDTSKIRPENAPNSLLKSDRPQAENDKPSVAIFRTIKENLELRAMKKVT
jgi:hypothetical protein